METALGANQNPLKSGSFLEVEVVVPNYKKSLSYKGIAKSVTAKNSEGTFDILPMHENFVTLVRDTLIVVDGEGKRHDFAIGNATLEATDNSVKVFVEF